jgi:hypothetical protein
VLWGDYAYFQRSAFAGLLKQDGGGHWLWLQFAQIFAGLPIASVAYRLNLLSAAAATVTLIFLSGAMRALNLNWTSIIFACIGLAVSHTFWMHAVRAEVYTVFTAVLALQLWLWLSWRPEKSWPVHLAAGLFGLTLLAHQMAVLFLPAALFLLWQQRHWFSQRDWFIFLGAFAGGLLPFIVVVNQQIAGPNFVSSLRLYFTHVDVDFAPAMFDFSLSRFPLDFALWLGLLGLQFVGLSGLLGIYGLVPRILATEDTEVIESSLKFSISSFSSVACSDKQNSWLSLLIFYAVSVFFAFSYRVNDQFVFYLPSYIAFSFFIANGWQKIQALPLAKTNVAKIAALLLIIGLPVLVYFAAPRLLAAAQLNPLDIRTLPGRDPNQYFLWPASHQDYGAETYARSALQEAAANSVIIADHTPFEPLLYLQTVEGVRPDVNLIRIEPGDDLAPIVQELSPNTDIYLADNNPNYYNLASLPEVCLKPAGNIYQLLLDAPSGICP